LWQFYGNPLFEVKEINVCAGFKGKVHIPLSPRYKISEALQLF
jgi:hypothetical protein